MSVGRGKSTQRMLVLATLERELRQMVELVQSGTLASEYPFNTALDLATRINDFALSGDAEPTTVSRPIKSDRM